MVTNVVMPKLGLTMESGIIGSWLVEEGEYVRKGQPLLEVITDKVTMEVEAQENGIVRKIFYEEGSEIEVSKRIAIIAESDENIDDQNEPLDDVQIEKKKERSALIDSSRSTGSLQEKADIQRTRVSPKAKKIAVEHNVDISSIVGSGAHGRIVSVDIEQHLYSAGCSGDQQDQPLKDNSGNKIDARVNQTKLLKPAEKIASLRLTESYQQIPHIQLSMEISAIWLEQLRSGYKQEGKSISYSTLIIKGIALALEEFPRVNSHYSEGGYVEQEQVNIGLAVAAESGLIVPVIKTANQLKLENLSTRANLLIDNARHGRLSPDDCIDGTFTISNLGMMGIDQFTAIINPPQVAIMAVGAIQKKVIAVGDDGFALRPRLILTLGSDHRVLDGAISAQFLLRVKEILETPGLIA